MDEKTFLLPKNRDFTEKSHQKQSNYTIEPVLFLLTFAWNLSIGLVPNLLLKQTCLYRAYNHTQCSNLNTDEETKQIEEVIQPEVARILMIAAIINSFVPGIVTLFLLPWSDKYGRKKVICASISGHATSLGLLGLCSTFTEHHEVMSPWIYVIAVIPNALTGEVQTFRVAALCYITDNTEKDHRSSRFFFVEILTYAGMLLAFILTSFSFVTHLPSTVIYVCFSIVATASIYAVLVIPAHSHDVSGNIFELARNLFSIKPIREVLKTCTQNRAFKERKILWCLLILIATNLFKESGTATVFYLFLREKFSLTLQDFSILQASATVTAIMGCSFGLCLLKKFLKFEDTSLAVIAVISAIVESLMLMTAQVNWILYLAIGICSLKSLLSVVYRSLISSHVPNDEIGKVFSFTNFVDSVSSLTGSPVYTFVYSKTLLNFPGAFLLISLASSIASLALIFKLIKYKS